MIRLLTFIMVVNKLDSLNYSVSDDTTYLEIFFNVTACDTQTYECYVLDQPNNDEGRSQQALAVENCKCPNLEVKIVACYTYCIH